MSSRPRGRPRKAESVVEAGHYQYSRLVVHLQGNVCEYSCRECRYRALGAGSLSVGAILNIAHLAGSVVLRGSEPMFWPHIVTLLWKRDEPGDVLYTHMPWEAFCLLRDRPPLRKKVVMVYHSLDDGGYLQPSVFVDRAWKLMKAGYNVQVLSRQKFWLPEMLDLGEGYDGKPMEVPVAVELLPSWDFEEGEAKVCAPRELHVAPNGFVYPCEAAMLHDCRTRRGAALGTIKDMEIANADCRLKRCQGPGQAGPSEEAAGA